MNKLIKDIHLEGEISVRAYHVCMKNNITDIEKLVHYYNQKGDFKALKNSGEKTDNELKKICIEYGKTPKILADDDGVIQLENTFNNLNDEQQELLSIFFNKERLKLNNRANNVVDALIEEKRSLLHVFKYLRSINFDYSRIRNIGELTIPQVAHLFESTLKYLSDFESNENDIQRLRLDNFCFELKQTMGGLSATTETFIVDNFEKLSEGTFPLFKFFDLLFKDDFFLPQRDILMLQLHSQYFKNIKEASLQDIADTLDLSKERVRQLTQESIYKKFWKKVNDILLLLKRNWIVFKEYNLQFQFDYIQIKDESEINEEEDINFNIHFYYKFFSLSLEGYQVLMGDTREAKYLIRNELYDVVDFESFFHKVGELADQRIEQTFLINLKGLMMSYLSNGMCSFELFDRVLLAVESILIIEYGLVTDLDGNINVRRNTKKHVFEYIIDVFTKEQKVLHIDDISLKLKEYNLDVSPQSVRSHLLRYHNYFIVAGLSTYGLKEWEKNGRTIGGSIKDIVEQFLTLNDEPMHLLDIARFVLQYRDTNINSIYRNIQIDNNRFILFGQNFIGLVSKKHLYKKVVFNKPKPHWFSWMIQNYFIEGKSIYTIGELRKRIAQQFSLKDIQAEWIISNKIEEGKLLLLSNDTLSLNEYN